MLTQERLKQLLEYDPETGIFTNRVNRGSRGKEGEQVGSNHRQGYIEFGVDGKNYLAHRMAWLYMTGQLPENDVDHINGNRKDNRWCNLRLTTRSENLQNRTVLSSYNTTGYTGVCKMKSANKFLAYISTHGRRIYLGLHDTAEQAYEAYLNAKLFYHSFPEK